MACSREYVLCSIVACLTLGTSVLAAGPQLRHAIPAAPGGSGHAPSAAVGLDALSNKLRAAIKPATPVWPELFSAMLFQNRSGALALTSLYYDWKHKRNLNLIQTQLGARGEVWDVEHDNGTSFIFSRQEPVCKVLHFDVGILYPNWLENATLLGQDVTDGFVTNVWTKSEFIKYYNDDASDRPVRWTFLWSGADFHVMRWAPGDALSQAHWQVPDYCFNGKACGGEGPDAVKCPPSVLDVPLATGRLMRRPQPAPSAVRLRVPTAAGGAARQAEQQLGERTGGRAAASLKR